MKTMPEAYRLRHFYWQLFVTLTFRYPPRSRASSLPIVFVWLRNVTNVTDLHFKRLMWALRFEVGPRSGRGHYHLCLAGIPRTSLGRDLCLLLESAWQRKSGGLAEVALYDRARDGIGYILKLPDSYRSSLVETSSSSITSDDDCEPMLSNSLLKAIRRGRM
jgi:hypothetical protein